MVTFFFSYLIFLVLVSRTIWKIPSCEPCTVRGSKKNFTWKKFFLNCCHVLQNTTFSKRFQNSLKIVHTSTINFVLTFTRLLSCLCIITISLYFYIIKMVILQVRLCMKWSSLFTQVAEYMISRDFRSRIPNLLTG